MYRICLFRVLKIYGYFLKFLSEFCLPVEGWLIDAKKSGVRKKTDSENSESVLLVTRARIELAIPP